MSMSMFYFEKFLAFQLLPPALFCNILFLGLILCYFHYKRSGFSCLILGSILLFVFSLPITSQLLVQPLQPTPLTPQQLQQPHAGAIVVLSGGNNYLAPEYATTVISNTNLTRLRYAAFLAQKTHLPILISGASVGSNLPPAAQTMAGSLQSMWGIKARWIESRSVNTEQNAIRSAQILKRQHIQHILLVTSASHMPRALLSFKRQGIQATAAATDYMRPLELHRGIFNWVPRSTAFMRSYLACYEYIGLFWYKLRGWA